MSMQAASAHRPSVTVIVCTRDRPEQLDACLRALASQPYPEFEVLVVDNASGTSLDAICTRHGARMVLAPVPGLTRARNIGARAARGEIVAYIDDDAIVQPGWLEALVADFADPAVAAVSGQVRYMKALGESRAISDEALPGQLVRPRGRFDRTLRGWFCAASFGGIGDGGNMAFRRLLVAHAHPFDERLGRGRVLDSGDEHVLFAALLSSGYSIAHNPAAVVLHPSPPTREMQEARRASDLRSSIAYLIFLWNLFPGHRCDMASFVAKAILKRVWFTRERNHGFVRLGLVRWISSAFSGLRDYSRARIEWASSPARFKSNGSPAPHLTAARPNQR